MTAGSIEGRPALLRTAGRSTRPVTGLPPHDIAAEEATIAALLLDEDAWRHVEGIVEAGDFFREQTGWVFAACAALAARGEPVTIPTVAHELDRAGHLDAAGGEPFLAEVAGKYFTAIGVEAHARIVARDAAYRRLIAAAGQIAQVAYEGGPDVEGVLRCASDLIAGVETGEMGASLVLVRDVLRAAEDAGPERGVTTGYAALDRIVGSYKPGQVTIVGAFTDGAKTAFLAGSAVRAADRSVHVAYLPLEDTATEIAERMVDHAAGVSASYIRQASLTVQGRRDLLALRAQARAVVGGLTIWMPDDDHLPRDVTAIRAAVAHAVRTVGVDTVYVDHLDALPVARGFGETTAGVVAEWMREFKRIAIEFGVHVVVASQVNREANRAGETIPRMAHLKESSAKEQNAQTVVMLGLAETGWGEDHRVLQAYVEKVKGFEGSTRFVVTNPGAPPEEQTSALYLDRHAGAVYEWGAPPLVTPPALAQAAFAEVL